MADLCDTKLRWASNWLAPTVQTDDTLLLFFPETQQVFVTALGSGLKEHNILAIGSGPNPIIMIMLNIGIYLNNLSMVSDR